MYLELQRTYTALKLNKTFFFESDDFTESELFVSLEYCMINLMLGR